MSARMSSLRSLMAVLLFATAIPFVLLTPANAEQSGTGGGPQLRALPGAPQTFGDHIGGLVQATLDGSASYATNGDPLTYKWRDFGGVVISTGPTAHVILSDFNTFTYVLTVCDIPRPSLCASASTTITVVEDLTPPLVDAPNLTVKATEPDGALGSASSDLAAYLSGGKTSATDDLDPHPSFVGVEVNGVKADNSTLFPLGETKVTVNYIDQAGNLGSSTSKITVTDKQDNDIFVYGASANSCCFNAIVYRVRNGVAEEYCQPTQYTPFQDNLMVDSEGRVVFQSYMGYFVGYPVGLFRCNSKGAQPESLAEFKTRGLGPQDSRGVPEPPEAFPGMTFDSLGSLHLQRVRSILIDDDKNNGNPTVTTEDAYVLAERQSGGNPQLVRFRADSNVWEGPGTSPDPIPGGPFGPNSLPYVLEHGGSMYSSDGYTIRRTLDPIKLDVSGNVAVGGTTISFDVSLSLFGLVHEVPGGTIVNDQTQPHVPSGCPPPPPTNVSDDMPTHPFGPGNFAVLSEREGIFYDEYGGAGLLAVDDVVSGPGAVSTIEQQLLDDNPFNDDVGLFRNGPAGCSISNSVLTDGIIPYFGVDPTTKIPFAFGEGPITSAPNGLYTVFGRSPATVYTIQPGAYAPVGPLPVGGQAGGIGAFPAGTPAPSGLEIYIRVDSPVEVLATDPNGNRIGVVNGQPVNDFGGNGFDSGPGEPRFFAVRNPIPGDFTVQSVGTGTGPYTVHVYSVNLDKKYGQHIKMSGTTSPGMIGNQNFTLGSDGGLNFTNHPPNANAGGDQTVTATSSDGAVVILDASASSDPDGDPLTFVWAGPFGLASGAVITPTLPIGTTVVEVTITDSHGASSKATATITVLPGCATDVSGGVIVNRGGYRWNPSTGRFVQTVSLTNNGTTTVTGPISLVLDGLTSNITLYGATGSTACVAPQGSPYITASAADLAPGASASVTLQFTDPTKAAITYNTRLLAGAGNR